MQNFVEIEEAISLLKENALIAYPTETFYALGTCIFDNADMIEAKENPAINKIFQSKQRDNRKSLPIIVKDIEQSLRITDLSTEIKEDFLELANRFWPESLSFCLKASDSVPDSVLGGSKNIVLRQSPHRLVQEILDATNCPLISTSANVSGQNAVCHAEDISTELEADAILRVKDNMDIPKGGQASTIIQLLGNKKIMVLREGAFDIGQIFALSYTIGD